MPIDFKDTAQIRLDNALALFDEFVSNTVKHADAATLRGLEGRFAERLQIQPSYWSQIKGRSRQIGERLARQFEELCDKPPGWMDQRHDDSAATPSRSPLQRQQQGEDAGSSLPQDDDERFIVGLVLTYYRRHPQRARTRLLDLLGEVLTPAAEAGSPAGPSASAARAATAKRTPSPQEAPDLWKRTQAGVAPLKRKR